MIPTTFRSAGFAALVLAGLCAPAAAAQLRLAPESALWLTGDSSLHVYHSTATELSGTGEMDVTKPFPAGAIKGFSFVVPVKGLRSGKAGLDQNMQKALKAEQNPDIVFRLSRLAAEPQAGGGFALKAEGTLSVAGREKAVVLDARAQAERGKFMIEGEQKLLMTDFGIKPPVMMLGAIKTRDEVTIGYRIFLTLEESAQEEKQ